VFAFLLTLNFNFMPFPPYIPSALDNAPAFVIRGIKDFPNQPINGVIYLNANTNYTFVGFVDLQGLRLVCKGVCGIIGLTSETSFIASSGLGAGVPLITSTTGGDLTMRNITIINITSGVVFNVSGGGAAQLNFTALNLFSCNIGTLNNTGNILFTSCALINSYGIIYDTAVGTIAFSQTNMSVPVGKTLMTLAAALVVSRRFRIKDCPIAVPVGAIGINFVSGVTIPTDMIILNDVGFSGGSADYVVGVLANDLRSRWLENRGVDNSANSGYYSMNDNATATTVSAANTFYKLAGTTTAGTLQRFAHSNNRLTYTGVLVRSFAISATSCVSASNNNLIQMQIRRYNSANVLQDVSASTRSTINSNNRAENVTAFLAVVMQANDYIEIWASNSANANITATELIVMVI
jgi:hypothetical protein